MSLHQLANHVQSAGRGEDKVLVHMTPGEVKGLQSIAMAHGGSLTLNPETGLPEAGFLSSILPIIAGFALGPAGFGIASSALGAGAMVGGATALATGSLSKGLMAGLGAYGGAGLGGSLAAAGEAALPGAVAPATSTLGGTSQLAKVGAENFAAPTAFGNATAANTAAQQAGGLRSFVNPDIMAANPYGLPAVTASPGSINFSPPPITAAPPGEVMGMPSANPSVAPAPMDGGFRGPVKPLAYGDGITPTSYSNFDKLKAGFNDVTSSGTKAFDFVKQNPGPFASVGLAAIQAMTPKARKAEEDQGMIRPYTLSRTQNPEAYATNTPVYGSPFDSSERTYFNDVYTAGTPYKAPGPEYKATGGLTAMAIGGPVEEMAAQNAVGQNTGYPMANMQSAMYSNPQMSRPTSTNVLSPSGDVNVDPYSGEQRFAEGGISHLGDYSDGGRLLRGPGDGVSDDIPAQIGSKQPARLADGEFVIPARIVSELGNGSTEAGARQLYAMMDRVQKARGKTVGKDKVAVNSKARKHLPA